MNLPNLLSLVRVLLIPIFVILILQHRFDWALVAYAIAGVTDGVDGLIARITHQRTELGAYLDPIADKLLLSAGFLTMAIIELLPSWLTVIVITRDLIILLGFFIFILTNRRPKIEPSLVSKITTGFQISTIILALVTVYHSSFKFLIPIAVYGTLIFTITSGTHYIYLGTKILNEKGSPLPSRRSE